MKKSDLSKYMATIGAKGGRVGGGRKVRGDAEYYRKISKKAAAARKKARTDRESEAP